MKTEHRRSTAYGRVVGVFADLSAASAAAVRLANAGFGGDGVTTAGGPTPVRASKPEREERFLLRLVIIIVAWSMLGAAVGVVMGLTFNAFEIGPGGTAGLGIQVASWAIFAHIMAGMWAGYAHLTTGESRQPVTRTSSGRVVVSVDFTDDAERERAVSALRAAGASTVATYAADGRRSD